MHEILRVILEQAGYGYLWPALSQYDWTSITGWTSLYLGLVALRKLHYDGYRAVMNKLHAACDDLLAPAINLWEAVFNPAWRRACRILHEEAKSPPPAIPPEVAQRITRLAEHEEQLRRAEALHRVAYMNATAPLAPESPFTVPEAGDA